MGTKAAWKKLIHDTETISYMKECTDYRIIIEARYFDDSWEIVKKYLGGGLNFAETYSAASQAELRSLLKKLRSEKDLSRNEIKNISQFKKKEFRVLVRRAWKEDNAEKWHFSINDNFANFITVHYGRDINVDIVMDEQLKYVEEQLIAKLFETLGLAQAEDCINQNVYYFSKKNTYFVDNRQAEFDFEYVFE